MCPFFNRRKYELHHNDAISWLFLATLSAGSSGQFGRAHMYSCKMKHDNYLHKRILLHIQ